MVSNNSLVLSVLPNDRNNFSLQSIGNMAEIIIDYYKPNRYRLSGTYS